jgi:hypothetical protein
MINCMVNINALKSCLRTGKRAVRAAAGYPGGNVEGQVAAAYRNAFIDPEGWMSGNARANIGEPGCGSTSLYLGFDRGLIAASVRAANSKRLSAVRDSA